MQLELLLLQLALVLLVLVLQLALVVQRLLLRLQLLALPQRLLLLHLQQSGSLVIAQVLLETNAWVRGGELEKDTLLEAAGATGAAKTKNGIVPGKRRRKGAKNASRNS